MDEEPAGLSEASIDDELPQVSFVDSMVLARAVHAGLASIVNRAVNTATVKDCLDSLIAAYPGPINCEQLVVPAVNTSIWRGLPKAAKLDDAVLQRVQATLRAAISAVSLAFTSLKEENVEPLKPATKCLGDAVLLSASCLYNLSLKRRDLIKPHLKTELRSLCATSVPVGQELFGNLKENIQAINDGARLLRGSPTSTVSSRGSFRGRMTYNRGGYYRSGTYPASFIESSHNCESFCPLVASSSRDAEAVALEPFNARFDVDVSISTNSTGVSGPTMGQEVREKAKCIAAWSRPLFCEIMGKNYERYICATMYKRLKNNCRFTTDSVVFSSSFTFFSQRAVSH